MARSIRDLVSSFEFGMIKQFLSYNSESDKTNTDYRTFVRGSLNVYKKRSGTIANRPGQKIYDPADTTLAKVDSEFVWNTSWGATLIVRVSNSKLQVYTGGAWQSLLTGLTKTRYVFDTWWDNTEKKDRLLLVNGSADLQYWSGGIATVLSSTTTTITKSGSTSWAASGFASKALTTAGSTTTRFDITNTSGTTFRYTYDGTGTDPSISSSTIGVGGYVLLSAQNFNSANNGFFTITGVGSNYFEVTNAAGIAENDKTIGTGYVYLNFNKVINIGGTLFAYTGGETTTTLTGVLPDASAIVVGTIAIQSVITIPNIISSTFLADWIKVLNNRLFIGSYTSRNVSTSSNTDFTNFTVPGTIIPGSPNLIVLDQFSKGMGIRNGNAHIGSGTDSWFMIAFTSITVGSTLNEVMTVTKLPMAPLIAPLGHEFIETVGNNLIYLSQDQQLRTFGDFKNLFVPAYPSISINLYTELSEENFTGGHVRGIGEFIYITAPASGKVYLHQSRQTVNMAGNVTTEKIWHSPFVWNLTRVEDVNGTIYGFSNANPQMYQLWGTNQWHDDSPSGENLPYTCILAMSYYNSRRQGLIAFDKIYTEGYIGPGTALNLRVLYNYQGFTNIINAIINSIAKPVALFSASNAPSIGDDSPGDDPIGDGLNLFADAQDQVPKFRCINSVTVVNVFEYELIIYSEAIDAQWEILAMGSNVQVAEQQPTFIINK